MSKIPKITKKSTLSFSLPNSKFLSTTHGEIRKQHLVRLLQQNYKKGAMGEKSHFSFHISSKPMDLACCIVIINQWINVLNSNVFMEIKKIYRCISVTAICNVSCYFPSSKSYKLLRGWRVYSFANDIFSNFSRDIVFDTWVNF